MNLRSFEYLLALEEEGSFVRAADACGVSQPALSIQIKKFEEDLGVRMLERDRKGLLFTPCGKEVLERARIIMRQVTDIRRMAELWHDPYAGELSIGAIPTLAPYFLPQITDHLVEAYPNLRFNLIEEKTEDLLSGIGTGALDAAFLALPVPEDRLEHGLIFTESFLLGVSPRHAWARRKTISPAELAEAELLLLEEGHCLSGQSLSYCDAVGIRSLLDFRATSMETLLRMIQMGRGVSLIPECVARRAPWLHYLRLTGGGAERQIALVWRKSSVRRDLMLELVDDLAREYAG